ncbi:LysR family transcriptional regulator [Acetonema longum]|uniref:LysR family transcriptional regulator n=1 Tax=Acetonema longum DSM 6540 TaxID=1009370 RepID=F7NIB5_9FIRM|nr:LysR family transcriptional regulator [Acetonema longum]EGO64221.1 LysR family transcriptional regulator [Acetonema longum DSM 6540]
MDFKELETFMKLLACGTYSLTAKELFISQPTVTTRIQALENELGVVLLKRSGKGYCPTEAGNVLAGYAEKILQMQDECLKTFSRMGLKSGVLRIGATALGTYILPDVTRKFKERYPDTKLFFAISNTSEALDSLKNGLVDVLVVPFSAGDEKKDEFHFIHVGHDSLVLVTSTENPIAKLKKVRIHDLRQERFIVREQGSYTRRIFEKWLHKNGFDSCNIAEIEQSEAIYRAVAQNAGISLLSTLSLRFRDPSIKALDAEGFPVLRQVYVVTRSNQKYDPLVSAFSIFVEEFMEEYEGYPAV